MTMAREWHTATLLPMGQVLAAGWSGSAELYDPVAETWTATGWTTTPCDHQTALLLLTGDVLLRGAGIAAVCCQPQNCTVAATNGWTATATLTTSRQNHTATLLPNGRVLVAGGTADRVNALASAELFDRGLGYSRPVAVADFDKHLAAQPGEQPEPHRLAVSRNLRRLQRQFSGLAG